MMKKITFRYSHTLLTALCLTLTTPAAAVAEPTTTAGVIAQGTKWETPYLIIDSRQPGPTVLVTGGLHGNEPAGHRAALQVRHWPIARGKLLLIAAANQPGLDAGTRYLPGEPDDRRDLNRNFPRDDEPAGAADGELAQAIWRFCQTLEPDWVLDLHEGYDFHISHKPPKGKKKSVGSSVIYFGGPDLDPLVSRMLDAVNATIDDPDRKFSRLSRGPVSGSLARASVKHLGARAMILETTSRRQPISTRTRQHRMMVSVVLQHLGVIDGDAVDVLASQQRGRQRAVALYDAAGTGGSGVATMTRLIDAAPDMQVHHVGPGDLRGGVLEPFDVVLFPGGSGSRQAGAIGERGRAAVRAFVKQGGGYLGVCAGAYLCSAHYTWSLNLINTKVFTGAREIEGVGTRQMWYRGNRTTVQMEITDDGRTILPALAEAPKVVDVAYHNGPIVSPGSHRDLAGYMTLAIFRSEQVRYPPQKGTMIHTPAIIAAPMGRGRVIAVSPHPESTPDLAPIIPDAIRWVAGRREATSESP